MKEICPYCGTNVISNETTEEEYSFKCLNCKKEFVLKRNINKKWKKLQNLLT